MTAWPNEVIVFPAAEPLIKSVHLHGNAVMCLAADDTYIISGSEDCTVAVYDCRAMKALKKIKVEIDITACNIYFCSCSSRFKTDSVNVSVCSSAPIYPP